MLLETLGERRSVRKFTQKKVEEEKIDQLVEALLRCPSSRNRRPWEFVLVDDPQLLAELSQAKAHGATFLQSAALAIVIAADSQISDVWIEDCSIAAIVVQLVAEQLGLKSCWAQLRLRPHNEQLSASEFVRQRVALPEGFEVPVVIGIGYPDEEKQGHERSSLPGDKVHRNSYRSV